MPSFKTIGIIALVSVVVFIGLKKFGSSIPVIGGLLS